MVLRIAHEIGRPPADADVIGRWPLPRGGGVLVAVLQLDTVVGCWWTRRPRSRRIVRWYSRQVVPELHASIGRRWGLDGASLHIVVPSAATATAWATDLAATERDGMH